MKRKWSCAALAVIGGIGILAWAGYQLNPEHRFRSQALPVLVTPQPQLALTEQAHQLDYESLSQPIGLESAIQQADTPEPAGAKATASNKSEASSGFNILLLGIDRRGKEASRTDSIILIHVNPKKKTAALVSLPRDTRIHIPGIGMTKINHVHVLTEARNGNEAASKSVMQAVSNFFQVPIHYYVKTDFAGFIGIVDLIGGIRMNIPRTVVVDGKTIESGAQTIDGKTALALARERFSLPNGDFDRQIDQVMIVKAAAEQLLSADNILKLPDLIGKAKELIADTNLSNADIISLGLVMKDVKGSDLEHVQIPGKSLMAADPLVGKDLWYWVPDSNKVELIAQTYLQ